MNFTLKAGFRGEMAYPVTMKVYPEIFLLALIDKSDSPSELSTEKSLNF